MPRYVDAELAPIYLNKQAGEQIKSMPAVDARPERHGHWVRGEYEAEFDNGEKAEVYDPVNARCSECGGLAGIPENYLYPFNFHILLYPFCPHCGVKMDGGNGDTRGSDSNG